MKTLLLSARAYSRCCSPAFVLIMGMILVGSPVVSNAAPDEWLEQHTADQVKPWNLFEEMETEGRDHAASSAVALACKPHVNISLGQGGFAVLTSITLVLAPQYPPHMYVVDIMGPLTNTVYCEQIGQSLMVLVTELPTNNSCMSTIYVEDKLPPTLICAADTIPCTTVIEDIDFESFIETVYDNCDADPTLWYSYTIQNLACNPHHLTQRVTVIWTATDDSGNSSTCIDEIYLKKPAIGQIVFPPNTSVSCVTPNIDPSITGVPTYNGQPIDHVCQYIVFHSDQIIPMCNGARKVLRLWTVKDWCTGVQRTHVQEILIIDNTPPNITCPANITVGTSPGVCTTKYTIPFPVVSDACADPSQIQIQVFVSVIPGIYAPGQMINLGLGTTLITMRATDPCGNTRQCQYSVTVKDLTPPIPVCHSINVTLGPNGIAIVIANLLDFAIIEACGILSKEIWRMTDNCGIPGNLTPGPDVTFCCADIGTTVQVIFKVTDLSGNMNTCMFIANVTDKTPPSVVCKNVTISVTGSGDIIVTPDQVEQSSSDNCQIISKTVTPNTFDCTDIGNHVVTLTVTDQSGNTATCTAIVTIVDDVPPVAECQDITVTVDENGEATITTGQIDNGSSDNCAIDTMFLDRYLFDCDDEGDQIVKLTVVDFSGNMSMCTAIVTVQTSPPTAECQDITVSLDANGQFIVTADQIDNGSTDDCGIESMEVNPSEFTCEDIGVVIVTLTVTDISGHTATCTASVTIQDNMPPDAQCQNISVMLDENGMASITAEDINDNSTDNCEIVSITVTPTEFGCEDVGNNVVTLTVTDQSGNSSTCTALVMVDMPDPPVAECQDVTITLNADGTITLDPLLVDNGSTTQCGILTYEVDPNTFDCEDVGEIIIVTLTVTDETGTSATCTAQVTILESPPTAICKDITVELNPLGEVVINGLDVNDNSTDDCGIISYVVVPSFFDCENLGENVVTLTVTDGSGFTSTCTAIVTVEDNVPPTAVCLDITVELDQDGMASIVAADIDGGSTDNCTIVSISVTPSDFDCANVGPNVVTLTVTDQSGNTSTCTATVTVETLPPLAMCVDITVSLGPDGIVVIFPEDVDAGSGSGCGDLDLSIDIDEFDCTAIGDNIVTLTVTDQNGSSSTCTATVTVVDDTAPECSAQDLTVYLDANGNASIVPDQIDNNSTDNCQIETIEVDPTAFTCDDLGDNVVTLTVTDESGNSSTCTAIVTVVDTIAPFCLTVDITVSINGNGMVTILATQVDGGSTDNCGPPNLSVTPNTFTCDDLGDNVVVLTVTDGSGNSSSCTATVTIEDSGSLEAFCQNVTIFLDSNGNAFVDPSQVDNGSGGGCTMGELEFDLSQTNFNCSHLGPNIVILTVTDENGATATCTATITVVDNIPPVITCPPNVTVDCHVVTDPDQTAQFGTATFTDNCPGGFVSETHIINLNNCNVGTILRTFTATDASGNTATCTQLVTVTNPNPLTESEITWPPSPISVDICSSTDPNAIPNGVPVIDPAALLCSDPTITYVDQVQMNVDNDPNTPCKIITRTWTIVDACQPNGTFTFVQTINVQDMVAPVFTQINDMTKVANMNCVANFTLIANATDCAGVSITNNSQYGATTGANASGDYPIGQTIVIFTATDGCGNMSTMDVVITVTDPNPTTFLCEKIIFNLTSELEITILAEEFITFIEGSCTDADDFIVSYSRNNPFDTLRVYDCSDVGVTTFPLYFWNSNGTMLLDSCSNADLDLRDPDNHCGIPLVISGTIISEDGHAKGEVEVNIMNAVMDPGMTDPSGQFILEGLSEGVGYDIAPHHDVHHREGVSTLDLVMIQKHLLGLAKLNSPYKMIAADANRSGTITALDLLEIRKLILGVNDRFAFNTSWRFVDRTYSFPDPYNPFQPGFPETVWIDSVGGSISSVDFIAVKTGDVNASYFNRASGKQLEPRSAHNYKVNLEPVSASVSTPRAWKLEGMKGQSAIEGLQMSVQVGLFSKEQVEMIYSEVLTDDQWYYDPQAGAIRLSWTPMAPEDLEGRVILLFPDMGLNADDVNRGDGRMAAEAYIQEDGEFAIRPVEIEVPMQGTITPEEDYQLFQNIPNPFSESTLIRFTLPREETVRLVVHDLAGRQVFIREFAGHIGLNETTILNREIGTSGIYYYTLFTLHASFTRKMSFTEN